MKRLLSWFSFMNLRHQLRALFRREKLDLEMSEEMRAHLELLAAENEKRGMSADEARYAARRAFGGVEQIKERARDVRGLVWLEQLRQDFCYAVRALRRQPSFTTTAVFTLALGIGVNAALFTVYNTVALRPLPVRDPDGLVRIWGYSNRQGAHFAGFTYAEYLRYRADNHALSGVTAANQALALLQRDAAEAERDPLFDVGDTGRSPVQWVSDNYFDVLGAPMILGRAFLPEECRSPGAAPVAVLSHLYWERQRHADPNVLGSTLTVGRRAFTIIGVTGPEFTGQQPAPPAAWLPATMWSTEAVDFGLKGPAAFQLLGRLQPGVTTQQATADLDVIAARLAVELSKAEGKDAVHLERGMHFVNLPINAQTLAALTPVLLGFAMVLVIACTNVANLLLARGVTRQQEIGMRLMLGASRGRMLRQLLTENVLLCAIGAVVGVVLAWWTLQVLQPLILGQLPAEWAPEARRWHFLKVVPDFRVAGFTAVLTLVASLAAGLLPAWHASGANAISTLKNDGTVFGRRISAARLRRWLVVAQVAVCLMLLSCAGLLARNLFALREIDLGFDPRAVFSANILPKTTVTDRATAYRRALDELGSLPGVAAVGAAYRAPLLGGSGITTAVRTGTSAALEGETPAVRYCFVSPGFFATFGIPLARGRSFSTTEASNSLPVLVVSESAARRLWPGEDAVGKTLAVSETAFATSRQPAAPGAYRELAVVGVARDITSRVGEPDHMLLYLLASQATTSAPLFVRPRSDSPATLAEIVRGADAAGYTLQFSRRLSSYLDDEMLPFFGLAVLSGALGGLALAMASVGLYGVMAFAVNQRVREIGIRVALGATARNVVGMFVWQGMRLVAAGIVLGLGGGALFALLLAKILFGLGGAFDSVAFGGVTVVFAAVALVACWLPARRAAKVDPMVALRCE